MCIKTHRSGFGVRGKSEYLLWAAAKRGRLYRIEHRSAKIFRAEVLYDMRCHKYVNNRRLTVFPSITQRCMNDR